MSRRKLLDVDLDKVLPRLTVEYPHIGIYDVRGRKAYCARNDPAAPAIDLQHGSLFQNAGGHGGDALVVKDRFMCFWFYPSATRTGLLQGYPVDWSEHNLLVRLDPRWSYLRQLLLPAHHTPAIEANINQQVEVAGHLLDLYKQAGSELAISVHMVGPRATDSLFYAHRWEPAY
jgi:hypothetical protein